MINTKDFTNRLQNVMNYYEETASSFAEKIGVQRSSISHILSGRNKPSLDFVLKVLSSFPEVELYWLINGKGHFPSQKKEIHEKPISEVKTISAPKLESISNSEDKLIERIVIFYTDGTFKNFEQS